MTKITSLQAFAGALLACGLSATSAAALANRTWVSGTGSNSNPCTFALPCKTFAFALTQTAAPGEIDVLAPGAYGPVTITSSISIINDGAGVAAIGIATGNAITINAGPSDSIHVRGLTIEGISGATNGIAFNTGGNLAIENCVIRGFGNGINIAPSTSSSFSVSNTIASNNAGEGINIQANGFANHISGVLSKVTANNNSDGISVNGGGEFGPVNVTIVDTETSNNSGNGVVESSASLFPQVMVRNAVASNNATGLFASSATFRVGHSVVTGNTTGVSVASGVILSYGDNDIDGNTSNNTGVLTVIPPH